jgi:hypothetical protein
VPNFYERAFRCLGEADANELIELCRDYGLPGANRLMDQSEGGDDASNLKRLTYKNHIGPQVRRRRYLLGWTQAILAAKLQIAGLYIDRSGVSKIESRLQQTNDKLIMFLADVLKVPIQELFPSRDQNVRLFDLMTKLETTGF